MRERGKREIQMDPHREVFWDTTQNQTSLIKRRIPLISNVISNQDVVNNDIITTDRFIDKYCWTISQLINRKMCFT